MGCAISFLFKRLSCHILMSTVNPIRKKSKKVFTIADDFLNAKKPAMIGKRAQKVEITERCVLVMVSIN